MLFIEQQVINLDGPEEEANGNYETPVKKIVCISSSYESL
jgi:hypothetical protein